MPVGLLGFLGGGEERLALRGGEGAGVLFLRLLEDGEEFGGAVLDGGHGGGCGGCDGWNDSWERVALEAVADHRKVALSKLCLARRILVGTFLGGRSVRQGCV